MAANASQLPNAPNAITDHGVYVAIRTLKTGHKVVLWGSGVTATGH